MIDVLLGYCLFNLIGNSMINPKFIECVSYENICKTNKVLRNYYIIRVKIFG